MLISENTHIIKSELKNSAKKENQLVVEMEQEIGRLTAVLGERETRIMQLQA